MFERDYIMKMLEDFIQAIVRSIRIAEIEKELDEAARSLEDAVATAVDFDGATFLALSPESIATIMQVSGTDSKVSEYIARSLYLCAVYYQETGDEDMYELRRDQALAICEGYGIDITDMTVSEVGQEDISESGIAQNAMEMFIAENEC